MRQNPSLINRKALSKKKRQSSFVNSHYTKFDRVLSNVSYKKCGTLCHSLRTRVWHSVSLTTDKSVALCGTHYGQECGTLWHSLRTRVWHSVALTTDKSVVLTGLGGTHKSVALCGTHYGQALTTCIFALI